MTVIKIKTKGENELTGILDDGYSYRPASALTGVDVFNDKVILTFWGEETLGTDELERAAEFIKILKSNQRDRIELRGND